MKKNIRLNLILQLCCVGAWLACCGQSWVAAQGVCLPAPRLLTTMPMGGAAGTEFTVEIRGENIDEVSQLLFSSNEITAKPAVENGKPSNQKFLVRVGEKCPAGIYEARVITRLGVSTARAFSVSQKTEVVRTLTNTNLQTALALPMNSICNAFATRQAMDYYRFKARARQRVVIECAASGIDSKLKPVVVVGDANGADLQVERRGGIVDFTVPEDGEYTVKIHDLTYNGGPDYFYRLAVQEVAKGESPPRLPATRAVNAFSWPPHGLGATPAGAEKEPNQGTSGPQAIQIPCDIAGSFFPAADVDVFEFAAKKGEVWWVEVASERLGLPTDPSIVVQQVTTENKQVKLVDVTEFSDIPSPIKVSSNGYSYDGPPYNPGSSDILGKLTIPADGKYRLSISDLFGGTRNDPRNRYRLVIRKAKPDFAVVAWGLHMNLRNGDRNALSKPMALRGGATLPYEVVVIRRDGFQGPIDLQLDQLPPGVSAAGIRIPAGGSRGIMLVTADHKAPEGFRFARFRAYAEIGGERVERPVHFASMKWPVKNAWSEIPNPRIVGDLPVSVSESEFAPITIATNQPMEKTWDVVEGGKLKLPLVLTRRNEFSGSNLTLKTFGAGFEKLPAFDVPLSKEVSETELDLGRLKIKPGEYTIAFYGGAVTKYRANPSAIEKAQKSLDDGKKELQQLEAELKALQVKLDQTKVESRAPVIQQINEQKKKIALAKQVSVQAQRKLNAATNLAKAKDIAEIFVSKPIRIRVNAAAK